MFSSLSAAGRPALACLAGAWPVALAAVAACGGDAQAPDEGEPVTAGCQDATIAATSSALEGKTTPVAVPPGTCAASLRNDWRRSGSRVMGGNNSALTLLRRALGGSAFRCRRAARPAFRPLCGGAVLRRPGEPARRDVQLPLQPSRPDLSLRRPESVPSVNVSWRSSLNKAKGGSVAKTAGWRFDTLERCPSPRLSHSNGATIPAR